MLDALSERLQGTFRRLGSRGRISEEDLDAALREVRVALLEADVNFKVVRDFIARVRERAVGTEVLKSITPAQQIVSIVNDELVEVLGKDSKPLEKAKSGITRILVCGIKGSGKTTLVGRLGMRLKREGMKPLLVATDFERVAATEQLQVLGRQIDVPVYFEEREAPAAEVAKRALREAERTGANAVIVDTRGAVALDDDLMDELAALADEVDPTEVLIVVDAMTGQEAVNIAREFDEAIEGTGIVVTKLDSDTRGGAVLSVREVTGLPVKFITTGERLEALEDFHPDRFAGRVLGMGDVVTLVERAREQMGEQQVEQVAQRMRSGQFDLEDFLTQLSQVKQMGNMAGMLDMIPGLSQLKDKAQIAAVNEAFLKQAEAIIQSMTLQERHNPDILNGSRRRRIALGSGTTAADVNRLLNQYREAKKLMQMMSGGGRGAGGLRRLLGF
ncbi:MAG: signal recognition particle protein [Dehalococcoidia bacterium]|nr:signal recognition particle protein [Dehalococcoidia bacterium]